MLYKHSVRIPLTIIIFLLVCFALSAEPLMLDKITLTGVQSLSADEMIESLNLPKDQIFEPELGAVISEKLQAYLILKGYYFATVRQTDIIPTNSSKVNLVFSIEEGFSGFVSDIRFSGNRYYSGEKLRQLLDISPGREIPLKTLPGLMSKTLGLYTSRGYLFAQVNLDTLLVWDGRLAAVVKIDEGPLFRASDYLFSGNKITKPATLLKISGLSQASQITPDILEAAEANILKKEYIRECRILPLDSNTLAIEIEEDNMTKAEGIFGLTTDPVTRKRNLNGFVNLQFLNLWGTDRSVALYWKSLKSEYQLLELSYHESGLTQYPVAGNLLFHRSRQDSAWIRIKLQSDLFYRYLSHKIGTDVYSETLYPEEQNSVEYEKTRYVNASLFWDYDKTDYPPNPTGGSRVKIKSGWLFKQSDTASKTIPVNEFDASSYFPLKNRLVLAVGLHFREISDKNARVYEQYKMGGFNSLRGYNEDAFSSWRLGWINSELRYLMTRDSRIFVLFDSGFLQTSPQTVKTDISGIGFGISNRTRIGIISVSYALSISDNRLADWDSGMLHMGLASSF